MATTETNTFTYMEYVPYYSLSRSTVCLAVALARPHNPVWYKVIYFACNVIKKIGIFQQWMAFLHRKMAVVESLPAAKLCTTIRSLHSRSSSACVLEKKIVICNGDGLLPPQLNMPSLRSFILLFWAKYFSQPVYPLALFGRHSFPIVPSNQDIPTNKKRKKYFDFAVTLPHNFTFTMHSLNILKVDVEIGGARSKPHIQWCHGFTRRTKLDFYFRSEDWSSSNRLYEAILFPMHFVRITLSTTTAEKHHSILCESN